MRAMPRGSMQSEINVTPLVDVCLVLLIIFMVVTPVLMNGMPVKLPQSTGGDAMSKALPVTIHGGGIVDVGSLTIRREQLDGELQRLAAAGTNRPVAVRADKDLKYADVVDVLDACREAGFHEVGLVTAKKAR